MLRMFLDLRILAFITGTVTALVSIYNPAFTGLSSAIFITNLGMVIYPPMRLRFGYRARVALTIRGVEYRATYELSKDGRIYVWYRPGTGHFVVAERRHGLPAYIALNQGQALARYMLAELLERTNIARDPRREPMS